MSQTKGIDWAKTAFVVGQRADLVPQPIPQPAFTRQCAECEQDTLTEIEYPADVAVVCNVCGSQIARQIEEDPLTQLLFDMSNAVKAHLIDVAHKRRIPIEVVLKRFVEWKLGRPVDAGFYNKSARKKAKK